MTKQAINSDPFRKIWDLFSSVKLTVVLLLTLALTLRRATAALMPLVTAATSVVWTLGFMAWLDIPVNIMTSIVPALVIIIGSTEDIHLLAEFRQLSAESRATRSLGGKQVLSEAELRYFTEIDQVDHFAIGAVELDARGRECAGVAVGRFVRLSGEPRCAEMTIAIANRLQAKGLGLLLLIGWIFVVNATFNAIGWLGVTLGAALFAAVIWLLVDVGPLSMDSTNIMTWFALVVLSLILAVYIIYDPLMALFKRGRGREVPAHATEQAPPAEEPEPPEAA